MESALRLIANIDRLQVQGCITQVLPSTVVISDKQLILASLVTFRAIRTGTAVSKKAHIEFLVRLFSTRHIGRLIKKLSSVVAPRYLLIRACTNHVEELPTLKEAPGSSKLDPQELAKGFNANSLRDLAEVYEISLSGGTVDTKWLHAMILTKIALSSLI